MNKFKKSHRLLAIITLAFGNIAYLFQLVYMVPFFKDVKASYMPGNNSFFVMNLFVWSIMVLSSILVIALNSYTIYRIIFDGDDCKEQKHVTFMFFIIDILYLTSWLGSLVYYWLVSQPAEPEYIAGFVISLIILCIFIPLFILKDDDRFYKIKLGLRFAVVGLSIINISLNLAYSGINDALSIVVASFELIVPVFATIFLISEA